MRIDIITLHPELLEGPFSASIMKRAIDKKIVQIFLHQLRDYSKDKHKVQNGYCGVTEVIDENVEVPISMTTKIIKLLEITRMPFTSASLLPIFLVASYFYSINSS